MRIFKGSGHVLIVKKEAYSCAVLSYNSNGAFQWIILCLESEVSKLSTLFTSREGKNEISGKIQVGRGVNTPDLLHPFVSGTPLATMRPLTGLKGDNIYLFH